MISVPNADVTPEDAVQTAKQSDEVVLRCTLPEGANIDYKAIGLSGLDGTIWVLLDERHLRGRTDNIVGVRNMVQHCEPDIQLIHESESLFNDIANDG